MNAIKYLPMLLLFVACGHGFHDTITGNGNVQERTVSIDTIQSVSVSNKLEATFILSDSFKVIVEADENLQEFIFVEEKYGQLEIYSDKNIRMAKAKQIYIYANTINSISVSSGADFFVSDSLNAEEFTIEASSSANVTVFGTFGFLFVNGSSAADINIEGSCEKLEVNMSSAADLRASNLVAKKGNVVVSSAGDARVHITEEASFEASSAGDIIYRGNPIVISSNASSAGDVKKSRN